MSRYKGIYRRHDLPILEVLLSRRIIPIGTGCWLWSGAFNQNGYADITIKSEHKSVHRLAYELWVGPIPEGKDILHRCNNRACWNPEHIYPGTNAENVRDREVSGRTCCGHDHPASKLTPEQVAEIRESDESYSALARRFPVGRTVIGRIKNGLAYKSST